MNIGQNKKNITAKKKNPAVILSFKRSYYSVIIYWLTVNFPVWQLLINIVLKKKLFI